MSWIAPSLRALLADVHMAARSLARHPVFAAACVGTLALGLGPSAAVFSVVDRLLFRSLPYANPEQIVSVGLAAPIEPSEFLLGNDYETLWRGATLPFSAVTTVQGVDDCDLTETNPQRLRCATVEQNFLRVLGLAPTLGRDLFEGEQGPVVLISSGLWSSRYGADPSLPGRLMMLDGNPVRIIGVLPREFEMPTLAAADILQPRARTSVAPGGRQGQTVLRAFGRLKPGVSIEQAREQLKPLLAAMLQNVPPMFRKEVNLRVRPLRDRQVGDVRKTAWLLLGAVLGLLLIACVNAASLMLARVWWREREMALRAALGAGRLRLARLALTESLVLALAGGIASIVVAAGLVRLAASLAPEGIPRLAEASMDLRAAAASICLSLLAGLVAGIAPALMRPGSELLHGERAGAPGGARVRQVLVAAQCALSVILLSSATMLGKQLWEAQQAPLGMDTDRVLTAQLVLGTGVYREPAQRLAFYERVQEQLARVPGLATIAWSDTLPPAGMVQSMIYSMIDVEGREPLKDGTGGMVTWRHVAPGYFEALRIPILRGRGFTEEDAQASAEPVIVLSESLERRLFPSGDSVGKRVRPGRSGAWRRVVGVARDVRNAGLAPRQDPEYYVARRRIEAEADRRAYLIARSQRDPALTAGLIRRAVAEVDPRLPLTVELMDQRVGRMAARTRFTASLLSLLAVLGLALAATGLGGVTTYLVQQRQREIAVRMALGATPAQSRGGILREALAWSSMGAVVGMICTRWLSHWIEGHGMMAAAALSVSVLLAAALAAAWAPAVRAARVDPAAALRSE